MKTIKDSINEFINDELFLQEYTNVQNLSKKDYDPKLTVKIGKRVDKNLSKILNNEEGIKEFMRLLSHENEFIKFLAARFLYPILPKTSLLIMKNYKNQLKSKIEIHEVDNVLEGFTNKQKIFMEQFEKLYNVEDLAILNREKL